MHNVLPSKVACKDYHNYKGIKRPTCRCLLCRELYIDNLEAKIKKLKKK